MLTAVACATFLLTGARAQAAAAYVNPLKGDQFSVGRTDMGVDFCLNPGEPIRAVGNGIVVGIDRNWFENQPYVWYELNGGPDAWHFVYVAEQIRPLVRPGQTVSAGQPIARYASHGTCIETGWSAADGATLAQATTGYKEGQITPAGVSFAHFLISLGVAGDYELGANPALTARAHHKRPVKRHAVRRVHGPRHDVQQRG